MKKSFLKKSILTLISAALLGITLQYTHPDTARAEDLDTVAVQDMANKSWDGTVYHALRSGSFAATISSIGTTNVKTVLIPASVSVSSNLTVPGNVTLLFWGEGCLNISSGVTLTINGEIQAPMKQIFTGSGTVSFSGNSGKLEKVYPQWWGAKGTGLSTDDDTAAIQAAVNAAATINGYNGGTLFFPAGYYYTSSPIILPRISAESYTRVVKLQGAGMKSTILGNSSATGFSSGQALIQWEARTAAVQNQSIKDMTLCVPDVTGGSAIHYKLNGTNILSETFKAELENLLIYGNNNYHQNLIRLEGYVRDSFIENVFGDSASGTTPTVVLEVDSAVAEGDGSGLNNCTVINMQGGLTRGGLNPVFKGRINNTSFTNCSSRYGSGSAPTYEFINSRASAISNISNAGGGTPQLKLNGCKSLTLNVIRLGNYGGNGIEFVDTDDCTLTGHYRNSSDLSFSSFSAKNLVLDSNSQRNNISNFHIKGTAANEIQDSGTDNYCEAYDITGSGRQFVGKPSRGDVRAQSVTSISGISATGTAAKNLRGTVAISESATYADVTFASSEADTGYYVTVAPVGESATAPDDNSRVVKSIAKGTGSFRINLLAAPGTGKSITYDWQLFR